MVYSVRLPFFPAIPRTVYPQNGISLQDLQIICFPTTFYSNTGIHSFFEATPKIWNQLPIVLKLTETIVNFHTKN